MYALNIGENGRILSATTEAFAAEGMLIVEMLPDGNISDYRYADGEYISDPLPVPPEPEPQTDRSTLEQRIAELEAVIDALVGGETP